MKLILSAAVIAVTLGVVAVQPAEARCWWNGYSWQCWQAPRHHHGYWRHHDRHWSHQSWYRHHDRGYWR